MIKEGFQPACDVYISSSCTEEWSGEGAPLICEYFKQEGIHLSMLLDEGGMIIEEPIAGVKGIYGMVGIVEKGYGDVKFIARGKGGHASAPGKIHRWYVLENSWRILKRKIHSRRSLPLW